MKYKVGEKVKVVKVADGSCDKKLIGKKAKVVGVEHGEVYPYVIRFRGGREDMFKAIELELVEEK